MKQCCPFQLKAPTVTVEWQLKFSEVHSPWNLLYTYITLQLRMYNSVSYLCSWGFLKPLKPSSTPIPMPMAVILQVSFLLYHFCLPLVEILNNSPLVLWKFHFRCSGPSQLYCNIFYTVIYVWDKIFPERIKYVTNKLYYVSHPTFPFPLPSFHSVTKL